MTLKFETQTCGRCMGSGSYPSAMWQGRCLKCNGTGSVLTANGRRAQTKYWALVREMCSVPAAKVEAGQSYEVRGRFVKIHEIQRPEKTLVGFSIRDGLPTEVHHDMVIVTKTASGLSVHRSLPGTTEVVLKPTGQTEAEILKIMKRFKGAIIS